MAVNPEDVKRSAEINRLISRANVHRMRGEYIEAEDLCREALALDESCVSVRELLADLLYARGQLEKAAEEYRKVADALPGHKTAETKYAKVVLEIGEHEYEKQLAQEMLENPRKFAEPPQHPLFAFVLSVALPGLGQIYNRERVKGAIIVGAFLLSILILAISPDTRNLFTALKMLASPGETPGKPPPIGALVYLFSSVLAFLYIYAVIDAPITAAKSKRPEPKIPLTGQDED